MAKKGRASIAKKVNPNQSKWLKNASKAIGMSTKNVFKDMSPNVYSAINAGAGTVNKLLKNAPSGSVGGAVGKIKDNKYIKYAQTAYKNAMSDLRSGNLNNESRVEESMMEDAGFSDFDSFFDDNEYSFDDFGDGDIYINASQDSGAMLAVSNQIQTQTQAHLKTSKASLDAYISMSSANMLQMKQLGDEMISHLNSIDTSIKDIAETNKKLSDFIDTSLQFYEHMGHKGGNDNYYNTSDEKVSASHVIGARGGVNFSSYKQYIQQNFKDTFKSSQAGFAASMIDDQMIKMAISNPLGFATEGMIRFMIPKMLTNTIKGVEESFTSFMPALLHKISQWGEEQATGMLGNAKKMFGKMFGLKMERTGSIDKSASIEKGPVPFDGVTKHAITEIITKELREQTSYLKVIAEHYGIDTTKARRNSEVFDWSTGKYIKQSSVTENIIEEIRNSTLNSMNSGKFGKELRRSVDAVDNAKDKAAMNQMIDQFMLRLEEHGKFVNLADRSAGSDMNKIMSSIDGDKNLKRVLQRYAQEMVGRNGVAAMDLSNSIINARAARNSALKTIQENPTEYNLYAARELDDQSIDELIMEKYKNAPTDSGDFISNNKRSRSIQGRRKLSNRSIARMINNVYDSDGTQIMDLLENQQTSSGGGNIKSKLSDAIKRGGDSLKSAMISTIYGNPDEALKTITGMFGEQFASLFSSFKDNFLTPIKESIFGHKDEKGFSREGIFSGVQNQFKDLIGMIQHSFTGKDYEDSKGIKHTLKDGEETVIGNLKKMGNTIRLGIMEKLFGKEEVDENGNPTGRRSKTGLGSKITETFREGLAGWQEAFFGKKMDDEEKANLKTSIIKNLTERLPSSFTGSALGAGVGLLSGGSVLGLLVGGPIGGAAMGLAAGFASKSEKFQNWLFGEKDEDGNRTGGFVSKGVQDYFKKNKLALAGGAALGAVKGIFTGGGLLGGLVGGPIAGALLGAGTAMITKSEMFKEFLFGNEKTGQKGLKDTFKSIFKFNKQENEQEGSGLGSGGKAFGMGLIGTGAGALSGALISKMGILGASLSPFGPVGGALIGLGLSIRAQKNTFKEWLFGKKEEDGTKKEGLLGQFRNMLHVSLFSPIKTELTNFVDESKLFIKYEVLDRIRFSVEPLFSGISGLVDGLKERAIGMMDAVSNTVKDHLINPIVGVIDDYIITPIRKAGAGIAKAAWAITKPIISLPLKLLEKLTNFGTSMIGRGLKAIKKVTIDPLKKLVNTVIITPTRKIFGAFFKGLQRTLNFIIKKPLDLIGGIAGWAGDKLSGVGNPLREQQDYSRYDLDHNQQRRARKEQRKIDYKNLRQQKRERKIRDENQRAIAKATNYQFFEDTEENRERAKLAGAKINKRIAAVNKPEKKEKSTAKMNDSQLASANPNELSETGRVERLLQRILNTIIGKTPDGKDKRKKNEEAENEDNRQESENINNNRERSRSDISEENVSENTQTVLTGADKIRNDIHEAGGLGKYLSNKYHATVDDLRRDVNDGYQDSFLQGKVNSIRGLIGRFNGRGYAKGTESASPGAAVVGENGPELALFNGGEKVFSNEKPLQVVVVGMSKGVSSLFNIRKKNTSDNNDVDTGDAQSIATIASESDSSDTITTIASIHGNPKNKEEQEDLEDNLRNAAIADAAKKDKDEAIEKGVTAEERQKMKEEEKDKAKLAAIEDNTKAQVEGQTKFSNIWSSIFSKKGVITGGLLMLVPLVMKFLKSFNIGSILGSVAKGIMGGVSALGTSVIDAVNNIKEDLNFYNENKALGDSKTSTEKVVENVERGAAAGTSVTGGILNEDGEWDHQSGAITKAKILPARKGAKIISKALGGKDSKWFIDKGTKGIKNNLAKFLGKNGDDAAKIAASQTDDAIKNIATKGAKEASEEMTESLLSKCIKHLKTFFSKVVEKIAEKVGIKSSGKIAGLLDDIIKVLKNHFPTISNKVSAIFGMTVSLAGTGVGLLLKDGLFVTLGAIDGVSGAAKLFRVDNNHVDSWMRLISAAFGAFNGTQVGSIVDLIVGLVASVTGVDAYNQLAMIIYESITKILGNDDKYDELKKSQEEFESRYKEYQDEMFKDQYETLKASGNLDSSVTLDQYKEGVRNGTYKAKYDSFDDYNTDKHASISDKIGKGITDAAKGIGNVLGNKNKDRYTDDKGNTYIDNKNGTYQVKSKDGKDLGYISKDAISKDKLTKIESNATTLNTKAYLTGNSPTSTTMSYAAGLQGEKKFDINLKNTKATIKTNNTANSYLIGNSSATEMAYAASGVHTYTDKDNGKLDELAKKNKENVEKAKKHIYSQQSQIEKSMIENTSTEYVSTGIMGYYKSNGTSFDWYDINGNKKQTGIDSSTMMGLLQGGFIYERTHDNTISETLKTAKSEDSKTLDNLISERRKSYTSLAQSGTELTKAVTSETNRALSVMKNSVKNTSNQQKSVLSKGFLDISNMLGTGSINTNSGTTFRSTGSSYPSRLTGSSIGSSTTSGRSFYASASGGFGEGESVNGYQYYSQNDPRWKNQSYDSEVDDGNQKATIGNTGCGPTAMSMIISAMRDSEVTPKELASYSQYTGNRDETGTNWNFVDQSASSYGIKSSRYVNPDENTIRTLLKSGKPVLLSGVGEGSRSPYTSSGHYVVAVGVDKNGDVIINDPRGKSYSGRHYKINDIASQTNAIWSFSNNGGGFGNNRPERKQNRQQRRVIQNIIPRMKRSTRTIFRGGGRGPLKASSGSSGSKMAQARKAVVGWMLSIIERNSYTQSGERGNVEGGVKGHGSGDCSSTCAWAYKKGTGLTIGSWTGDMYNNAHGTTVQTYSSGSQYPDESKMVPGDLIFFAGQSGTVGESNSHVEMYIGSGKICGHGWGTGPTIKNMTDYMDNRGSAKHWLYVVRYITDKTINNINVNMPTTSDYKVQDTFTDANGMSANGANSGAIITNGTSAIESSGATTTGTSSSILDQISGFISNLASGALDGLIAGKFPSSYESMWGSQSTSSESIGGVSNDGASLSSTSEATPNGSVSKMIMVGDSRTHGMSIALGGKSVEDHVYKYNDNVYFICKDGEGYDWLQSTAGNLISKYADQSSAVVFWLGVNDPNNAKKYTDYVNSNTSKWGKVFYVSPTPCDPNKRDDYNTYVKSFNSYVSSRLNKNIKWISIYGSVETGLRNGSYRSPDGIHYDAATYQAIYQMIQKNIGLSGGGNGTGAKYISKNTPSFDYPFGGGFGDSINNFQYYSQNDSRWSMKDFSGEMNDGATIGDSGCGPTAMSMVASQLTGKQITPAEMSEYAVRSGTRDETGTNWNFIDQASKSYGLQSNRIYQPSGNYIYNELASGHPMILSGESSNSGAYTKAGHYVVATGVDRNGNIMVNDPRGKSYSKRYNPVTIAKNTKAAWSFSNNGFIGGYGKKKYKTKEKTEITKSGITSQTTSSSNKLVQARKAVVGWMLVMYKRIKYDMGTVGSLEPIKCLFTGKGTPRGTCNTVVKYAYERGTGLDVGLYTTRMYKHKDATVIDKWSSGRTTPDESKMMPGDLIIFTGPSGKIDGKGCHVVMYIGCGKICGSQGDEPMGPSIHNMKDFCIHREKTNRHWGYVVRFITENNSSKINVTMPDQSQYQIADTFTDTNGLSSGGENTNVGSIGTGSSLGATTTGTIADGLSGMFSKVGSFIGELANGAMKGVITGDFNNNYESMWSPTEQTTEATITSTSTDASVSSGTQLQGSDNAEKIWNYLNQKGINDYGKAGLMGNLEAESGLRFNNVEDLLEGKIGYNDDTYTAAIDSGEIDKARFLNPIEGKQYGFGLAQWTSPGRKSGLYDLVKSRNVSIADPQAQMDWLYQELSTAYQGVLNGIKNASSVKSASDKVLIDFEAPASKYDPSTQNGRAERGQAYYDKYAKSGGGRGIGPKISRRQFIDPQITRIPITSHSHSLNGGGFGAVEKTEIDYNNYKEYSSNVRRKKETDNYRDLFNTIIDVLGTIATNTGATSTKLDYLRKSTSSVSSQPQSKNKIIVPEPKTDTKRTKASSQKNSLINNRSTRNQTIAEKIARGS